MAANLEIKDGNPIWLSTSIMPSTDTVVSPSSSPSLATIHVNSANVFTYVNVKNVGTFDLGTCNCATGLWPGVTNFQGFFANVNGSFSQTLSGVTFSATPAGDSISSSGGVNFLFGLSTSGRRAWALSPDGRFFAYVGSPNGNDWYLTIIALQNITRSNNTVINKGQIAASSNGIFAGPPFWNNINFGWAGSSGVMASGQYAGGNGIVRALTCPLATTANKTFGELVPSFPGQIDWVYLVSPCGSVVAFVPKILGTGNPTDMYIISTTTALQIDIKTNNIKTSVQMAGSNPSIKTLQHAANGVQINLGNGTLFLVDDPDCTFIGGGITVTVDRVKASTLPSGNLGVMSVGNGQVGQLAVGKNYWVQVPNTNPSGWGNQSEKHWCLLAQAYTDDLATVPRPWNGQSNPPAFPISKINCAQRNIEILP